MKNSAFISFLLLPALAFNNCIRSAEASNPTAQVPATAEPEAAPTSTVLDLAQLAKQGKMPPETQVDIEFDKEFKTPKTYRAYSLKALLEPYVRQLEIDSSSDAVVTFYCTDGYKPTQKLKELLSGDGFVAFRDEAVENPGKNWPDSLQAKLAPFYLVWKNVPFEDKSFPWPYALYKIEINKVDTIYNAITPAENAAAIAGFDHFRHYCIKCHSINKIGGNVGPELNYPKNITEYWDVDNMWAYTQNPQAFRYNARMAPIAGLTRAEFDEIIVYLQYIREVKPENGI